MAPITTTTTEAIVKITSNAVSVILLHRFLLSQSRFITANTSTSQRNMLMKSGKFNMNAEGSFTPTPSASTLEIPLQMTRMANQNNATISAQNM